MQNYPKSETNTGAYIAIYGGKLTSYRATADDVIARLGEAVGFDVDPSKSTRHIFNLKKTAYCLAIAALLLLTAFQINGWVFQNLVSKNSKQSAFLWALLQTFHSKYWLRKVIYRIH